MYAIRSYYVKEMVSLTTNAILPLEGAKKLCGKETIEECVQAIDSITDAQVVITDVITSYSIHYTKLYDYA